MFWFSGDLHDEWWWVQLSWKLLCLVLAVDLISSWMSEVVGGSCSSQLLLSLLLLHHSPLYSLSAPPCHCYFTVVLSVLE